MRSTILAVMLWVSVASMALGQNLQPILQRYAEEIAKPSRNSVGQALRAIAASRAPQTAVFLEQWSEKNVWQGQDGKFYLGTMSDNSLDLRDIDTDLVISGRKGDYKQLKPNGGVRRLIGTALVEFQLTDPDLVRRETAVVSVSRRTKSGSVN